MEDPKIGKPIKVRKFEIGSKDEGKKTLVWCHGWSEAGCTDSNLWKPLSEKYHLIFFDNWGWGANERISDCYGLESREQAKKWYISWIQKVFDALDLPPKFLLAAHSFGGHLAATYASLNIDRIEALFLMSPAGTLPYDPENYDPYNKRNPENATGPRMTKKETDKIIAANEANTQHPFSSMSGIPGGMLASIMKSEVRKVLERRKPELGPDFGKPALSEPYIVAIGEYQAQMMKRNTS